MSGMELFKRVFQGEPSKGEQESVSITDRLKVEEQLTFQTQILEKSGIIEIFADSKMGIRGIDNKEYPVPTLDEVTKRLDNNRDIILPKIKQGFTKLLIVPFAYSFDALLEKCGQTILRHHRQGKLLGIEEGKIWLPGVGKEPFKLDKNKPIRSRDVYNNCDVEGKIVYFPEEFSENHHGQTKSELLAADSTNAWQIWLLEDLPNIPEEGKGRRVGRRKQLEGRGSPDEFLTILQTEKRYKNESGLTPETELMYFLTHLEETNRVINHNTRHFDFHNGVLSFQVGAYFPHSGAVPYLYWSSDFDHNRADLVLNYFCHPMTRGLGFGVHPGVRVK